MREKLAALKAVPDLLRKVLGQRDAILQARRRAYMCTRRQAATSRPSRGHHGSIA